MYVLTMCFLHYQRTEKCAAFTSSKPEPENSDYAYEIFW